MPSNDRRATVERLAREIAEVEDVEDAWVVKGFRDHRHLVLAVPAGASVPAGVRERLHEAGLRGTNEVYGIQSDSPSFAGRVGDADRHRFADCRSPQVAAYE